MILRRRKGAPTTVEASEELLDAVLASAPAPLEGDEEAERQMETLGVALAALGEGQKKCVELFYLEGLSYVEVTRRSGYALNEVKSHIQNGKRKPRGLLSARSG